MEIKIINNTGCVHVVHSQEQLDRFIAAGWKLLPEEEPKPKKQTKKKAKE